MVRNQNYRFWHAVTPCMSGSIALALPTFLCFRLRLDFGTTTCLYLIIVVLLSLQGSYLDVIREVIVLARSETVRYNILIRTELAADLSQVMGDRVQLQQRLMNLVVKSIDAMKDVDGTRELIINSRRAENDKLLISVSDTGVGLAPQQADQIFNAFFTTKLHGTGMGLSISRSIIESHSGRLWAIDDSPRGASFCLTLPTDAGAHK
ncbi:MAG TPA: ATP-binding protein [Candidatus Dormibacteraeota bacterium]|nr:ATP-binding protein [Candidatus Dormibacteraeota bacterium]